MKYEDLGRLVATKSVVECQKENKEFTSFLQKCLKRYMDNDWGELCKEDKQMNDKAVAFGEDRIMASYQFPKKTYWHKRDDKLWIITEWDHSGKTILFPSEY